MSAEKNGPPPIKMIANCALGRARKFIIAWLQHQAVKPPQADALFEQICKQANSLLVNRLGPMINHVAVQCQFNSGRILNKHQSITGVYHHESGWSVLTMLLLCIRKARSGNVLLSRQFELEQQAKIKQSSAREDPAAAPWYYFTKEGQPSPLHWKQLSLGVSIFSSVSEVGFSCGFSCFLLIFYISLGEWPALHLIKATSKLWSKEKNVLILWPF